MPLVREPSAWVGLRCRGAGCVLWKFEKLWRDADTLADAQSRYIEDIPTEGKGDTLFSWALKMVAVWASVFTSWQ